MGSLDCFGSSLHVRCMDDGKDGGHGADPGCLLDARACVGSHGFAAGVCFKNPLPISNMLPSMIELPPCPTMVLLSQDHSHRIRGRCLVPRPGNVVPIRGSGSKRVSVSFKVGSRPGLRGVAAPLLEDLIGIRRLLIED